MTNTETLNLINELRYENEFVGIRTQDETSEVGECCKESNIWVDGEPTEETLNGTCCTSCRSERDIEKHLKLYYGETVILIGGQRMEYGEDDGEMIIENAKVLAIVE